MKPGEIYLADLGEAAPHPVIVISRESLNRGDRVLAVLVTSQKFVLRSTLPHCVPFRVGQFGFSKDCVAQCENVLLLNKDCIEPIMQAVLDDIRMREIIKAIGRVMDADCEPI